MKPSLASPKKAAAGRKRSDIRPIGAALYFLPIQTRLPLKFGPETLTHVTCARVCLKVANQDGETAEGWGETPLSVQWVWPEGTSYESRHDALKKFCLRLAESWATAEFSGHPMEIGHDFQKAILPGLVSEFNRTERSGQSELPWLAALVCGSAFDLALHDAYGNLLGRPTYETYTAEFMNRDLASYLQPAPQSAVFFDGKFPADFLLPRRADKLVAWHLVAGLDPVGKSDSAPDLRDGHPVLLPDWIKADGLKCLKIKLRGNDADWDLRRLIAVGAIAIENEVTWLSADFNCTVSRPEYVNEILDHLRDRHPRIYGMILYVEQPFPYDLERNPIDVHSVSARKPLFLDESAHDWELIKFGRELGWSGVALKTCKTQTGALLSVCWAKAHGMSLMVQDLTNPMLAQITHVLLAAHVGTIMGVETNAMQFYPDASRPEAEVHPGLYRRVGGCIFLDSVRGSGFGYQLDKIRRELPAPVRIA